MNSRVATRLSNNSNKTRGHVASGESAAPIETKAAAATTLAGGLSNVNLNLSDAAVNGADGAPVISSSVS